jgi:hypothetical protein
LRRRRRARCGWSRCDTCQPRGATLARSPPSSRSSAATRKKGVLSHTHARTHFSSRMNAARPPYTTVVHLRSYVPPNVRPPYSIPLSPFKVRRVPLLHPRHVRRQLQHQRLHSPTDAEQHELQRRPQVEVHHLRSAWTQLLVRLACRGR